jgi:hypothetical protein
LVAADAQAARFQPEVLDLGLFALLAARRGLLGLLQHLAVDRLLLAQFDLKHEPRLIHHRSVLYRQRLHADPKLEGHVNNRRAPALVHRHPLSSLHVPHTATLHDAHSTCCDCRFHQLEIPGR